MKMFSFILAVLLIWRGIMPLKKVSGRWKVVLAIFSAVVAFNFVFRRYLGVENLPAPLALVIAWCFAVEIFFCGTLVICEVILAVCRFVCRRIKVQFPVCVEKFPLRAVLFVAAMVLSVCGMIFALQTPLVREHEIVLPGLPRELDGMTIAHLTDIHADSVTDGEKIAKIVRRTNALQADLIVLTGDLVDRRVKISGDELKVLGFLRAPMGVFGVPGNHEYYSGYQKWADFFRSTGIEMLENRHVVIAGGKIVLGGVTDKTAEKMGLPVPDVKKAFAGAPDGKLRILLAHQPKVASLASGENVALQISGHTHGGIIWGVDLIISAFNHFMVSGEYQRNGMKIFVSNGSGIWSGFPVRLGRPAEIALLRLRCK